MAGGYDDNAVVYDTCSICKHLQVQCSTSILDIIPISVLCLHIYIYMCVCMYSTTNRTMDKCQGTLISDGSYILFISAVFGISAGRQLIWLLLDITHGIL